MKGETLDGEIITIKFGQSFCGIGFLSVTFTAKDLMEIDKPENFAWLQNSLMPRMVIRDEKTIFAS